MLIIIFLSSGLFLGWSLGANDAANVFGSAVGSKMLKFKTAAIISSICIVLGAGTSGAGASKTLTELGSINEIAGCFIAALAAAATVSWMTAMELPVSTSQAIVGAIVGWNYFSGEITDYNSFMKIFASWIFSPLLAGFFSAALYKMLKTFLNYAKIHLIKWDFYNRAGLIIVGAFGSYSLGANNVANVMGVFVPIIPFKPLDLGFILMTSAEQLYILGGIAIAVGVYTYSQKIMQTVGKNLFKLNPEAALVAVLSTAIVMFLFSSEWLEGILIHFSIPPIPLVPVSSTQAIIGSIIGIGLLNGGKGLNFRMLGKIASGWLTTPIVSFIICFISLFFFQNVFQQRVYTPVPYMVTNEVAEKLASKGIDYSIIQKIQNRSSKKALAFREFLRSPRLKISEDQIKIILEYSRVTKLKVDLQLIQQELHENWISNDQIQALKKLDRAKFDYTWQLYDSLSSFSNSWTFKEATRENRLYNQTLKNRLNYINKKFTVSASDNY